MNRWTVLLAVVLIFALAAVSCSSGGGSPVTPTTDLGISGSSAQTGQSQIHLWGYYDCYIDLETMTVEAVENRSTAFSANVVQFVNGNPANLSFNIKGTPVGTGYIDVDIDVSIKHPFPGMTQYNGYDVRGIFCGDGSGSLDYSSDLDYPVLGTDQFMLKNPSGEFGAPDGYTRWFNKKEFGTPGICGYTPGLFASKTFNGTASLMPYKYFADGLGATEDVWEFLMATDDNGVFAAGKTNTRNYYLRFPNTKGVVYGYAILANWIDETTHPANALEAVACNPVITPNIYYVDDTDNGGDLIADINIWGWTLQPTAIFIESNMFDMHQLDPTEMTPTGGTATYSTYHVEIPTTNVEGVDGNEFWVIAELDGYDYSNTFGIPNSASTDNLAAFFRYDVFTADIPYNADPICDLQLVSPVMPYVGWAVGVELDATGTTDPDVGDILTYSWDFDGDLVFGDPYDSGTDDNPTKIYSDDYEGDISVFVEDGNGGESTCSVAVDITAYASKNIPLRTGVTARDIAMCNNDGDLYVLYSDGQVWKYTEASYYQTGNVWLGATNTNAMYIDASNNGDALLNSGQSGFWSQSYYENGTPASNHSSLSNYTWNADGFCPYGGPQVNNHCTWWCYSGTNTIFWGWQAPSYGGAGGYIFTEGTGTSMIHHLYLVGMEAASDGYVYCLEKAPEYRVERRYPYLYFQSGATWGGFGDTSPAFNDPRDITRNNTDTFFVLDELSTGDPAIKKFSSSGTPGGTFGNSTTIPYNPLRIEGSNRLWQGTGDPLIFVLHGDATNGFFMSIFFPSELT